MAPNNTMPSAIVPFELAALPLVLNGSTGSNRSLSSARQIAADNDIDARGASLEVLPAVRTESTATANGKATRMAASSSASKFSATSRGVVFNHAMQSYGVLTGEITFKMKGALRAEDSDFPAADYPGLAKLTNPNVYVVTANAPSEYVALFNRLKARADVEWVEAIVDYSAGLQRTP